MLSELLPSPELHNDWKSFARALIAALDNLAAQSTSASEVNYYVTTTPIDPGQLPPLPANYLPVWLNSVDANLYLGNEAYDPPTAPNIVYIDTGNLADAAIEVNKLADGAVTSAKILNATIGSADIGNAQIISALIGDAQIVSAKILDLAVNEAKIANLAVTSGKIANLAVGTAHIQTAAITSALIGTAQVLTAHIADAQITNAKIGNTIQSSTWNPVTKQGWHIDKTGLIQGAGVAIYDTSGNLVFGSGGTVSWNKITGFDPSEFGNRVTFSRFELPAPTISAYGWVPDNAIGLAGWFSTITTEEGYKGLYANANFTANGQYFDIRKPRSVPVTPGERLAIGVRATWTTGWTFQVIIGYFNAAGANIAYNYPISLDTANPSWVNRQTAFDTVPAGAVEAELFFRIGNQTGVTGTGALRIAEPFVGGATANQTVVQPFSPGPNGFIEQMAVGNISSFIANAAIQQAQIANLAVGTAQIQDLAVTSAKILSLDAAKINAATLSAITANVGLLRTASSGARLEIESNQIRVYDASNVLRVRMGIW